MYATYEDYASLYGGTVLSEEEWPALERKAAAYVDQITYDRLRLCERPPAEARLAVCAVAEVVKRERLAMESALSAAGVKSFTNDGYSETLAPSEEVNRQFEGEKREAAGVYLPLSHPLRYAGIYGGPYEACR